MPNWNAVSCFRPFKNGGSNGNCTKNDFSSSISGSRISTYIPENKRNSVIAELSKKDGGTLGLIVSGGSDKGSRPRISSFKPGSIAHRSDCLAVGDYIISVNGIQTSKLKHEEIVSLLKNAGDTVTLEVEYEIPSFSEGPLCVCPKVIQLKLEKENNSFGFTLRGGACNDKLKCRPLTVTHVRSGGPANREGSIKSGDRLLAIDGINLTSATLQEALNVIRQISDAAIFTIEYDISVIDAVRNAAGALLVEIEKTAGSQLGISLTCLMLPDPAIVIESIRQASIAERCGALHVGDHVLAIDGMPADIMTTAEAMQQLKSSSDILKLEILPVSQLMPHRVTDVNINRSGTIPHYVAARASFINSCYNTLSSLGSSIGPMFQLSSVSAQLVPQEPWNRTNSYSVMSSANRLPQSIGHADITEVVIATSHHGCGLSIEMKSFGLDMQPGFLFISSIESGSPAEKSSVLQIGDRILAINGTSVQGLTLEEVTQIMMHSYPKLLLKIEFDIAESVVPSSGTFVVKLVKKNECGLGITLTASKNRHSGDPLIISAVEKGSVAHRSGTIQPGDKLLAVDLVRMENCTVEDALAVLQSCSEIVTLRIRKDETFSDDPDVSSTIVYTVELLRHGGPLGITLSGTEEPLDPIVISGLIENGLAEKTGALHIGDRILAINGTCLRGKPLSEAILVLQSCGDNVMLKISRNPNSEKFEDEKKIQIKCIHCEPENPLKAFTTPLPSVDSALESWDSCNLDLCNSTKSECKSCECSSSKIIHVGSNMCQPSTSGQSKDDPDLWGVRSHSAQSMHRFSRSPSPSDDGQENWTKVLEDLQTCGQSQLLRQIEYKILGSEPTSEFPKCSANSLKSFCSGQNSKCLSDTLSEQSLLELNAQIEQLQTGLERERDSACEESKSNCNESTCPHDYLNQLGADSSVHNSYQQYSPTFPMPLPVEIHKVTLFKDQVYEDFGFSISDGLYDHGVYINRIRAGGPADLSGLIKPYDRILQVNNIKTYDHDCCLTVPLIAASGDRIELLISRPAYENEPSSESACRRICGHLHWSDCDSRECSRSPVPHGIKKRILTKTL